MTGVEVNINPVIAEVTVESVNNVVSIGSPVVKEYVDRQPYTGAYEITPSAETQTLETLNLRMTDNVTINPIPSNYGLITWNGAFLTVS